MTITLEWWWCIALAAFVIALFHDIASWHIEFPWLFAAVPFAIGIILGHYL